MKTYTPTLDAAVLDRLRDYAALFADEFPQAKPARWAGVYLQGLLLDGERKSIEPLSRRVTLPEGLTSTDPEQALQQFVNQSPWDEKAVLKRYRAHLAQTFASPDGIFLFDDVSFPKQGTHSVGVQRQYCGALGKTANCQVAVSVHYVSPKGHYPLDLQLYLPDSWLTDTKRLDKAGVPQDQRHARTKPEIALELLDRVRSEGLPGRKVVADAGYGVSGVFRDALEQRGLKYIVGVTGECADAKPLWLLIEKQGGDGPLKFAFSNLPAGTSRVAAVRLWKSRWPVEQGYQQLKEELGLDHFEGRSWRGFHHHTTMTLLAYGFLLLERQRLTEERDRNKPTRQKRAKKGVPSRC